MQNFFKDIAEKGDFFICRFYKATFNFNKFSIERSHIDELLRITIDSNLTFEEHVKWIFRKTCQKLHTLSTVTRYTSLEQWRVIMRALNFSQFTYCPLVWICHNRTLNNRINHIFGWILRTVYRDKIK